MSVDNIALQRYIDYIAVHDTITPFLLRFHYVQTLIMIEWTVDKWTNGKIEVDMNSLYYI